MDLRLRKCHGRIQLLPESRLSYREGSEVIPQSSLLLLSNLLHYFPATGPHWKPEGEGIWMMQSLGVTPPGPEPIRKAENGSGVGCGGGGQGAGMK